MKAVIPAAGDGTRAIPYSGGISKELLSCVDRPAINYVIAELIEAGITDIVVVTSSAKTDLNEWLTGTDPRILRWSSNGKTLPVDACKEISTNANITLAYQEEPLGLGHSVLQAKEAIGDSPFIVALPDDIITHLGAVHPERKSPTQVLSHLGREGHFAILTMRVDDSQVSKYGIVESAPEEMGGRSFAVKLLEKPDPQDTASRSAAIGRYVFQPEIFDFLEKVAPGAGGEIQLTDAIDALVHADGRLFVTELDGFTRYDLGGIEGYSEFLADLVNARQNGFVLPTVSESAVANVAKNPNFTR